MATYTINTYHKTIEYAGCEKAEAVLFAQLHEFEGYTLVKQLPKSTLSFCGTFSELDKIDPYKVFRDILAKDNPEYLEETVIHPKIAEKWNLKE